MMSGWMVSPPLQIPTSFMPPPPFFLIFHTPLPLPPPPTPTLIPSFSAMKGLSKLVALSIQRWLFLAWA